ncbi:AAA family ATPase [Armatimonas sp.]|uniref:AAA family ATPase n=1 Tax=Armatimonas sp. TaxID=1872638 RepID=UPI003751DB38
MKTRQPILYLLCGLSFAGKSTLAKGLSGLLGAVIIEADRYIPVVEERLPNANKIESWRAIQALAREAVRESLASGTSVIFDDLMVDPQDRDELALLAGQVGAATLVIFLDTPIEVVRERQRLASSKPENHAKWEAHTQLLLTQLVAPDRATAVYVEPGYDSAQVLTEIRRREAAGLGA